MLKKICIFLFLCASAIYAQEQPQPETNVGEPTVDVVLKVFKWGYSNAMIIPNPSGAGGGSAGQNAGDKLLELWYKNGDSYSKLNVSSGAFSKSIRYKGPQTIVFYARDEIATDEGKKYNYRQVAKMTIPLGTDELFAMMMKTGRTVSFYPMNISPKELPKEKIAVINMTSQRIAIMVGGSPSFLGAGANKIFKPKKRGEMSVEMIIARMVNKKWTPVYHNNISTPKDARCIVLLYDPTNSKSPKFNVQLLTL